MELTNKNKYVKKKTKLHTFYFLFEDSQKKKKSTTDFNGLK